MTDDESGTDDGEPTGPDAEEPASLDGFDPEGDDPEQSEDSPGADDEVGGFQFGGTDESSDDETSGDDEIPDDDGERSGVEADDAPEGDDLDATDGSIDLGDGSAADAEDTEDAADAEDAEDAADAEDAEDAETATIDLEDDPSADDPGEDQDDPEGAATSAFASRSSDDGIDADGATDEAVEAALADVELDDAPVPSVGTDGGQSGGAVPAQGDGIGAVLGPDEAGDATGPDRPRVSTVVEDPETVDARFVAACPVCAYAAGDDELPAVAAARAKHAAHAGPDHVPDWARTEGLVTPETFMTTEVRTVACADCGTERWIADRATAQEFADDHESYTTHGAVEVTTRHVEAPSPEGLLAVVVALTDPPGGATDIGDDSVPGVSAAAVEEAFVDGALRAFEPDEDRETLAARTARAVEWRIRRLRERGRLAVDETLAGDGAETDRRLLATDRGREVVESTVPDDGLDELSVGPD